MSSEKRWVLSKTPPGTGFALDLGGGGGELCDALESRGYRYVNVDLSPAGGGYRVRADAHRLPFRPRAFDVVVSSDTLEHFADPLCALGEARRVLKTEATLVLWVPFMQPFHGNDYYRFTPLGLRYLLSSAGLTLVSLEAPLWISSVVAQAFVVLLQRLRMGFLERVVERLAEWLDRRLARFQSPDASFAAAFLAVARPGPQ